MEAALLAEAKYRWLTNRELFNVLQNPGAYGLLASEVPAHKPEGGTIQLFRKQDKTFRKDGHEWKKKNNSLAVRENYEKLKIDSIEMIYCCYTASVEKPTFHRRIYWLLRPKDTSIEHVLVHHLDTSCIGSHELNHDAHLTLMCDASQQHIPSVQSVPNALPCTNSSGLAQSMFRFGALPNEIQCDGAGIGNVGFEDDALCAMQPWSCTFPAQLDIFDLDSEAAKSRIKELENRVRQLETQNAICFTGDQNALPFRGTHRADGGFISEICPEWALENRSTKVLLTGSGFDTEKKLLVDFGGRQVAAVCVQAGVLRVLTPAHPCGTVRVQLMEMDGTPISNSVNFEFCSMKQVVAPTGPAGVPCSEPRLECAVHSIHADIGVLHQQEHSVYHGDSQFESALQDAFPGLSLRSMPIMPAHEVLQLPNYHAAKIQNVYRRHKKRKLGDENGLD